jgi:oxygen-independent coproporphyrinogen-3 oxidase
LAQWQATLNRALALGPEHLSCYALSLEHGTPMRAWVYRGLLPMPDPDLAAEMYEWTSATLEQNGYGQYEISNWARVVNSRWPIANGNQALDHLPSASCPPLACRHNLQYWRNLPYLGFGAGAHGYAAGYRYSNALAPAQYIERLTHGPAEPFPFSAAVREKIPVTSNDEMGETMMMGLRLVEEGVSDAEFQARFGQPLTGRYGRAIARLQALNLIEWHAGRLRLTRPGRLLGNRVFREFV